MLLTTTINRLAESRSCDHLNRIGKTHHGQKLEKDKKKEKEQTKKET